MAGYEIVKKVSTYLKINTPGEYRDLYLHTDVLALADCIETMRLGWRRHCDLDMLKSVTLPSASYQAMLKKTGVNDSGHMQIANHLARVANHQVRSVGGWAGNLCFTKQFNVFPSDVALLLVGARATVCTLSPLDRTTTNISVESFLRLPSDLKKPLLLVSLRIPSWSDESMSFKSFKFAARRQNSHATVNVVSTVNADSSFSFILYEYLQFPQKNCNFLLYYFL